MGSCVLLLSLYFEFPDGTAHFIGDNARSTIRRENLFLLRHFRRTSAKIFGQKTKKGFYLMSKCFLLIFFSRTQISADSVRERSVLAAPIAKFRPLREPIRMLLLTLDLDCEQPLV